MSKRGNGEDINTTPSRPNYKNSRFVQQTVDEHQQNITALLQKYPEDELVKKIQASFEKLGTVLEAVANVETAEEKERKRSLVVIGLPESTDGDSISRADSDHTAVVNMLRALDIECRPDKQYRMGRTDVQRKGPRLLKVVMPSSFLQRRTLAALKSRRVQLQKVPGFQRALVRPSLSPEQLAVDRELRENLKEKKKVNPKVRMWISRGQIVVDGGYNDNDNMNFQ
jgi:hypothetical protein